ncbi:hypothetical protein PVAP13_7NG052256, partial [Panicum virgatum]
MGLEILRAVNTALEAIGLEKVVLEDRSVSHCLFAFGLVVEWLAGLKIAMRIQLEDEGHAMATRAIEYALTCLRSWVPDLSLDPIFKGPKEGLMQEAAKEVRDAASDVTQFLVREPDTDSEGG